MFALSPGGKPSGWLRGLFFLPLAAWSMLVFAGILPVDQPGIFLPYWFMYYLGVATWWTLSGEVSEAWLWVPLAGAAAVAWHNSSLEAWTAIATALVLLAVGRTGRMNTLLAGPILGYLGRISYSLYLVHPLVGSNFIRVVLKLTGRTVEMIGPLEALVLFAAATGFSVATAHVLYRLVEVPTHALSRHSLVDEHSLPVGTTPRERCRAEGRPRRPGSKPARDSPLQVSRRWPRPVLVLDDVGPV